MFPPARDKFHQTTPSNGQHTDHIAVACHSKRLRFQQHMILCKSHSQELMLLGKGKHMRWVSDDYCMEEQTSQWVIHPFSIFGLRQPPPYVMYWNSWGVQTLLSWSLAMLAAVAWTGGMTICGLPAVWYVRTARSDMAGLAISWLSAGTRHPPPTHIHNPGYS